jgi:hypothetical protein
MMMHGPANVKFILVQVMSACMLLFWWICTLAKMLLLAFPYLSVLSLCNGLRTAEWIFMAFTVGPKVTVFNFG